MKVIMFGWEFPPNISGGLRTIRPEEPLVNIYLNYNVLGGIGLDVRQRLKTEGIRQKRRKVYHESDTSLTNP